ncbi:MAG TPA: ABC transporter ATP-binding protein [Desulfatiglandales bacterium]|nr:ABC transporter ATP-binding protein [Desulfatiglandales bacterium]
MLSIEDIHTYYGNSYILQGVSLCVEKGEIVTLLGRNGMGKSTTIKTVMGLISPRAGRVLLNGANLVGLKPYAIAQSGVGFVPEDRRTFPSLTVLENLNLPVKRGLEHGWSLEKIYEFFPKLKERSGHKGFELSGGEQQMLAIARVLRMKSKLILMDEPTEGLAPLLVKAIEEILKEIKREGITTLLVEQNSRFVTNLADRHYVLCHGRIVYEGSNEDFSKQENVKKEYLGI